MKAPALIFFLLAAGAAMSRADDEFFDGLRDRLTMGSASGAVTARLSGTVDLEAYRLESPAPGLLFTPDETLVNPRLTLFLDAQAGRSFYFFAQARVDRGFDAANASLRARFDEYALRYTPWEDGRISVQVGKFATVVGNWVPRHGSWENPFVTAPLAYEQLAGVWDSAAARSANILLAWAHVIPAGVREYTDKHLRLPIIWGPSYTSGVSLNGKAGRFSYAAEIKNGSLSSRPEAWTPDRDSWRHPTVGARLGFQPNVMWSFGLSGSRGVYLRPSAGATLPSGYGLSDYRQTVLGGDLAFAWRYWQLRAELFHARYEIPVVGNPEIVSGYLEGKYKFTPRFSAALRFNQQTFGPVRRASGQLLAWGRDVWRVDVAPAYRFTPHVQVKLQYSLEHDAGRPGNPRQLIVGQFTVRF